MAEKEKVKEWLSQWAAYFAEHPQFVTQVDLKRIMSVLGMIQAYTVTQCSGQCLKCGTAISQTALPEPNTMRMSIQHMDENEDPTGVTVGQCKDAHSCPLCVQLAFEHSGH